MKSTLKYGLLAAALVTTLSTPAFAWHGHGHGGYGWGWGGFAVGAAVTGLAIESAYLGTYPRYAYPYTYAYPAPAPIYIEQTYVAPPAQVVATPPVSSGVWYFCRKSNTYYPYVRSCAGGWEQVPASPPR